MSKEVFVLMVFFTFDNVEDCEKMREYFRTDNRCVDMIDWTEKWMLPMPPPRPENFKNNA
tara:strand:+ start:134 stop:313 length:180 start_codon:yes stop_codon:yes gene_type:complete